MTHSILIRYVTCSSDEVNSPNLLDTHKTYRSKWAAEHAARKMNTNVFKVRIQYKNWLVRYFTRFFQESLHSRSVSTLGGLGVLSVVAMLVLLHQGAIDEIHALTLPVLIFAFCAYDVLTDAWLYMPSKKQTFEPMFSTLVMSANSGANQADDQTAAFFDYWGTAGASAQLITV